MKTFETHESNVRSYCRSFPAVFTRASGPYLFDRNGRAFIDFFAGAGVINYGHNPPELAQRLCEYIQSDGIAHSLDMATAAKGRFIEALQQRVLKPRGLRYKVMFPGPTGTNAVESALKLARKVTGRTNVIAFSNAFHGMTLGSLALTANGSKREGAGVPLDHVTRAPFDGYHGPDVDTLELLERQLEDASGGVDAPAAVIVETVQGEGGINVASGRWLRGLQALARRHGALFIVDDIQVGCGRTGTFFSFEEAGLEPDIVCLSKALSGFGLPLAVVLMRPELDAWKPGEHNGTFRGNNHAFVTGAAALELYWSDDALGADVRARGRHVRRHLEGLSDRFGGEVRGRGLVWGLDVQDGARAQRICRAAFERGVIMETSGADDQVVKLLPPLTIDDAILQKGLDTLTRAVEDVEAAPLRAAS